MSNEIVFYKDNKEVDSIDPVKSHHETDKHVMVDNGCYVYEMPKSDFDRYEVIPMRERPLS